MPTIKGVRQRGEQSGTIELGQDKVLRRYALEYLVIADNTSQGSITIWSTTGLPKVGVSTYSYNGESDPYAVCKRKTPKRDPVNPLVWTVRVDYDNDPNSQSQENEDDDQDATERPAIVEWDSEFTEEVLHKDFSETPKAVVNPLGEPFDPPPTRRVIHPVLTVERYQATFSPVTILAYTDHVNDDDFYGAAAGHALMTNIRARQVVEDGTKLWQVTYRVRFAIGPDGFKLKPLNQGTHFKDGSTKTPFTTPPHPATPAVARIGNLNADGTAAADGVYTYSEFVAYPEADFAALALE